LQGSQATRDPSDAASTRETGPKLAFSKISIVPSCSFTPPYPRFLIAVRVYQPPHHFSQVTSVPACRKTRCAEKLDKFQISNFTNRYINRNSVINLFLTLNIKTFCCGWLKEDFVEKNPRILAILLAVFGTPGFCHAGTDVTASN
jgi:hypothetical protein